MSLTATTNLGIPLIEGDDLVCKEVINNAFEQIDAEAINKDHLDSRLHWGRWKQQTNFALKDIIRVEACPSWGFIECTQAGTTGTTEPVGFYGEGDTRTDGTVKWTLRRIVNTDTLTINADQVKYSNATEFPNVMNVKQALDLIQTLIANAISQAETDAVTYTDQKIAALINGAPAALDTLKELADALASDESALSSITLNLANKVDKVAGMGLSTNDFTNAEKQKVDNLIVTNPVNLDTVANEAHTHPNKALLDTYTQTEANLADAVGKKHSHVNKTVLDAFSDSGGRVAYNSAPLATKKDAIKYAIVL